jgi:tetrahydromethanopterin S-methyltransferase subunit F
MEHGVRYPNGGESVGCVLARTAEFICGFVVAVV